MVTNTFEAFLECQSILSVTVILLKELVQHLLPESTLVIEGHGATSMFVVMDVVNPDSEQRIRDQPKPWDCAPRLHKVQEACEK